MHRFITLACAVAAATVVVVGCGSSGDDSSPAAGGSGGGSSAACIGDYAGLTQGTFTAKLASDGKCIGSSDATAVCTDNVTATAESCGSDCFMKGGDVPTQDACTSTCLGGNVTPALSADCLGCYVADVACARAHCLVQCGAAPGSTSCANCRQTNGCVDSFYSCSGVPVPASAASGGSGGSGGAAPVGAAGEPAMSAGAGG